MEDAMQRYKIIMGAATLGAGLVLAGCASSGGDSGSPPASTTDATISVMDVPGVGPSLVNSSGRTLYFADAETGGDIRCIDSCARFWIPLTVPDGGTPTKDAAVTGSVTLITRPDGAHQVMYDNKPLYTFAQDNGPGKATGNGFTDDFNGTSFVWHAATVAGAAPAPTPTASTSSGYDDPGYGY
jgi:predicted lipoprotein with Yx(FWY)xxD motif